MIDSLGIIERVKKIIGNLYFENVNEQRLEIIASKMKKSRVVHLTGFFQLISCWNQTLYHGEDIVENALVIEGSSFVSTWNVSDKDIDRYYEVGTVEQMDGSHLVLLKDGSTHWDKEYQSLIWLTAWATKTVKSSMPSSKIFFINHSMQAVAFSVSELGNRSQIGMDFYKEFAALLSNCNQHDRRCNKGKSHPTTM